MTSNEKKVLAKFNEIRQGNTVTVAGTLRVTIGYAYDVCNKLCEKGYLERLSPGRFALYKITSLGEKQVAPDRDNFAEQDASSLAEISNYDAHAEEGRKEVEAKEEYECTNCGTTVREDEIECPKCGIVFEGYEEEPDHLSVPEDWKTCSWKWK